MSALPVLIEADPAATATPPNPSTFSRERQAAFLAALAANDAGQQGIGLARYLSTANPSSPSPAPH